MAQAGFLEGSPEEKDVILIVISNQNCAKTCHIRFVSELSP
jgi:hypothetical protein